MYVPGSLALASKLSEARQGNSRLESKKKSCGREDSSRRQAQDRIDEILCTWSAMPNRVVESGHSSHDQE
jgi:hypothetical protein